MNFKIIAPATVIAAALVFGTIGTSNAAEPQQTALCMTAPAKQVCGARGGQKFKYANACYALQDGAKVGACKAGKKTAAKKSSKKKS